VSADALATAVIAAAGSGERLGAGGPKALVEVAGRPLIAWSLDALRSAETVERVVIAAPPGHESEVREIAGDGVTIVAGGASRSESVKLALAEVDSELVVVHDSARPLAAASLFDAVVVELARDEECDALISAAPVADTLKRALAGRVIETVPRGELWAVQTPQAFRISALRGAIDAAGEELGAATDDAMLIESAGGTVRLFEANGPNPKLTTQADLAVVEALLRC
jgi:2-C-methyl-D-erythritol 4-phosphate cytidylyltransferase